MRIFVWLLWLFQLQGNIISSSIDEQCTFSITKYKYALNASFHYIPTKIIEQTTLNITADVYYYQSKLPCNQSFVKLQNVIINRFENDSIHTDIKQFEKAVLQIFNKISGSENSSTQDVIFSNEYENNTNHYRRIKTIQSNNGRLIGNSIIANYLLNKLFSPTTTACEIIININETKLENSSCMSTTAGILTIHRQITFDSDIQNETFISQDRNSASIQLTKADFDRLLKQICTNNEFNSHHHLTNIMNNDLHDEDLNKILSQNSSQYSPCEWKIINRSIIEVTRYQATDYLLKHFNHDETILEHHFNLIARKPNDHLQKYFSNSCQISNSISLRMLILIAQDNLTIECGLNRNNSLNYRLIAFRILTNPNNYQNQFRILLNNEQESPEIRILAFQSISSLLNSSEINHLVETVQSNQLRFYIKSLSKQSSIWLANSGSYIFPFGRVNIIFDEHSPSIIPNMFQLELANKIEIDFYFQRNSKWEILLIVGRKSIMRFSMMKDFFKWLNNDRLFETETMDGFYLKINLKTDFNLQWFMGYFYPFKNFFEKSNSGIIVKIQHGLDRIMTGYEMKFNLESNFKINIHQYDNSTSYIWRSIQKENILFKIEQTINPLMGNQQMMSKNSSSSSTKDFCYIIPHFDSKICLSFTFERLWPSLIAIRLLSDDPSLIYNLTSSNNFVYFNILQNEQIFRSYRFLRKYTEHSLMPYYLELSTPTSNYTSFITWLNPNIISFNLLNNNESIANGSGLYKYDLFQRFSVNITEINPNHIGNIFIDYNANLTIHLGREFMIRIDGSSNWNQGRIEIKAERTFFFFEQNLLCHLYYNLEQSIFNFTLSRNQNNQFQWAFIRENSQIHYLFVINTSLIEFDHHTQVHYDNSSTIGFQSSSLMNGWSLWNVSALLINSKQIQIQFNRFSFTSQIDYRTIQFDMNYLNQRLLRSYFHLNQSNSITASLEIPGFHYESEGKLSANYTNFSLFFPIHEKTKKISTIHFDFSSFQNTLIINTTSNFRNEYLFTSIQNLTFNNNYLYQSNLQSSLIMLKMMRYQLLSIHSFAEYLQNSTILQSWNGSMIVPSLFFTKPFLFNYKKNSQLFIQFFEWANLTRTLTSYHISTIFGLQLSIKKDLSTKIHIHLEQPILSKRLIIIFEIDHNWIISLIINNKIRYELISSPMDSLFLIKRIHLHTNKTRLLPINYYTDNQTLIRIEILFSKFFSTFVNDFILDLSSKNQSFKMYTHIPLFKREFFSLTWSRYFHQELFHFHGLIEIKFLRRRRFFDYEYNWNLASIRFWSFQSNLILFSFDPIQWNFNLTNDYLWNGKWAVDCKVMLGNRGELIRFHHEYYYTNFLSKLLIDLRLADSHYDLDFNYYHSNHSIHGHFIKNKDKHDIDGYWNTTENLLQLNTQYMKSITTMTSTFIKSIVDLNHQKIGVLFERTTEEFRNDTQILECNPYLIIQKRPRLFITQYYTLNDGLSIMMFEWSTHSYLSWNYTGNGRMIFPLTKFEIDIRAKYIFRFHTTTFKYSYIYNNKNRQLIIYREPIAEDADDRFKLKLKYHHNQTFFIHLQVINNHYEIIGDPDSDDFHWKLHGYFQEDRFNGSLLISNTDWWLSSKLNFNSSLYISTGRYVQLIYTLNPQIAFEILFKSHFHFALQYSGLRSLIGFKFFHNSSNVNLYFSSKLINETMFNISFQLNNIINQNWILEIHDQNFSLYTHNYEFIFNGSLQDFSFQHLIENKKNLFSINQNTIQFITDNFGFIISNLSVDTTKYIHVYHRDTKQNLTINYYKSGRFSTEDSNIQTPIYDINMIYHPTDDENRYVKILVELLPLQMSAFNFVRGRSFRIGYETKHKRLILIGNMAFGIEDIDDKEIIIMNERWKLLYGIEKREKIYMKWNITINSNKKTLQGRVTIQDPNEEMPIPVYCDINAYLKDMMFITTMRTVYSSSQNVPKPITLQISIDQRIMTEQYISLKLIHEPSKTNLSFTIDHYPQRRFHIRLKPNTFSHEQTFLHLYANTTESQLKLLLILANHLHLNLTLPKSYPETGILHSSLFIENEEYFDGRLDTTALKLRSKEYTFNISLNQLILQQRFNQKILASIVARWIERNSSTALITIFHERNFQRKSIPIWESSSQNTWLKRFEYFLFANNLTSQFSEDFQHFFTYLKTDFINEHGQFALQLNNHFDLDDDFKSGFQRINYTTLILIETLFRAGYFTEKLIQEYMNNLTCLANHQNIFHLNISQLVTLTIDTFVYEIISNVNKTLIMFNHFTHYSRSINAIIAYITNEVILNIYKFLNNFYLETKKYFLSKFIQYSHEMDFLVKISPFLSDSITFFSSNDLRIIIYVINNRLRRLVTVWMDSPIEYKIMKTIVSQLIEFIDKFRFYLDDKLDFLLPRLQIYTPKLWTNSSNNQTFLLTWSKQQNLSNIIVEE